MSRLRLKFSSSGLVNSVLCYIVPITDKRKATARFIDKVDDLTIKVNSGEVFSRVTLEQILPGEETPQGSPHPYGGDASRYWVIKLDPKHIGYFVKGRRFTVFKKNPYREEQRQVSWVTETRIYTTNGETYHIATGKETGE